MGAGARLIQRGRTDLAILDMLATKPCSKCGEVKPTTEFSKKSANKVDGLRSQCKSCDSIASSTRHAANRENENARSAEWYVANREKKKAYNVKRYAENAEEARARALKWHTDNPEKAKAKAAAWRAANLDKAKADAAAWYAANRDKVKAIDAKRYAANPDMRKATSARWRAANPERVKERLAKWRTENPEADRIYKQNRRARKLKNGGVLTKGLAEKLFRLQRGKCACCHVSLADGSHLDHRIPLALEGPNEDWNMQLLCGPCNLSKGAKHPVDFMQQRGFLL